MQSVVYSNTIDDIVEFNKHTVRYRAKWEMIKQQLIAGLIAGGLAYIALHDEMVVAAVAGFLAFLGAVALYPSFRYASLKIQLKSIAKKDPTFGITGRRRLECEADGLREICETDETFRKWSQVDGFTEAKNYAYIWVSRYKGYVLPRNRIEEGDLKSFLQALEKHLSENHRNS